MERTDAIPRIAKLLEMDADQLAAEIEADGLDAIGSHIGSDLTVDAHCGTHETGLTIRRYERVDIRAIEYGWSEMPDEDKLDPEAVEAWIKWCGRMSSAVGRCKELPYDELVEEDFPESVLAQTDWEGLPDYWEGRARRLEELAEQTRP